MKLLLPILLSLLAVAVMAAPASNKKTNNKARDVEATLSPAAKKAYAKLKELAKMPYDLPMYRAKRKEYLDSLPKSVRDEVANLA
ncbi:hypothetical protein PRIPAC_73764 [Pristionchus pacificus]|uniref:Uncharacterized protein n=1 Tax=Pristionchus pacificus TaxID=54126 RepID=A0A2A6C7U4_PRIPA|nr:hypothetical protein PRIPAC_73764 [Pristionchus pacificus]|eukprot:PDM74254.1 hypothetical protein PRIPAC_41610 [Pristionchus pacificus]